MVAVRCGGGLLLLREIDDGRGRVMWCNFVCSSMTGLVVCIEES